MQIANNSQAEETCFINNHQQKVLVTADIDDVGTKFGVKPLNSLCSPIAQTEYLPPFTPAIEPAFATTDNSEQPSDSEKTIAITELDGKEDFPEGGWRAWSVVAGSFAGCFAG